ncbi:DNA alkylation repair protein [Mucilaginibacter limnophilus]|uniref:DNA alkylation repair protein n=1 Tax=Mucilaginibacter limnophilus TaxID=1932778 RepID=A0A437MRC1_9SPHI|nr:DNA alkylation repair protein [Mucilaginibacter limnophilus]RVU00182.1 DNA alkylation repair protein [Mucilaginibacter limnophilus]
MQLTEVIDQLKQLSNPTHKEGMARFGIDASRAIGVNIPQLRTLAKLHKKNHELALALWKTGIHEARLLASMIDDPKQVTEEQFDSWTKDIYSWDLCDQTCSNLFQHTSYAADKIIEYSTHPEEFIKRTSFVLMACAAVHNKKADNMLFLPFLDVIEREAYDERNFVKKAVNWALRQIGKRNSTLQQIAIETARRIAQQPHKAAKWIAADALRELENRKVKN